MNVTREIHLNSMVWSNVIRSSGSGSVSSNTTTRRHKMDKTWHTTFVCVPIALCNAVEIGDKTMHGTVQLQDSVAISHCHLSMIVTCVSCICEWFFSSIHSMAAPLLLYRYLRISNCMRPSWWFRSSVFLFNVQWMHKLNIYQNHKTSMLVCLCVPLPNVSNWDGAICLGWSRQRVEHTHYTHNRRKKKKREKS